MTEPDAIEEITPRTAQERQRRGALLIDVREPGEHALGLPAGALAVARARLEATPADHIATPELEVLLICGSGRRSLLAVQALRLRGYRHLCSVAGGFQRWQAEGLPIDAGAEDADFLERYSRHLQLPQIGLDGQRTLARSVVLIIGAGGLGSPAAYYLAAAGVGQLILVDDDSVERSNLQRQILHREADIGRPKVQSAAEALTALNPRTQVVGEQRRLRADNVEALVSRADVVVDGADNFPTRYLLSDACVQLGKPMVYGAVHRFEGQVSVFDAGRQRGVAPCYRCLFPDPPPAALAPNCAEAGVLGVLPGIIGLLQANEALKLLLGLGESLSGRLLHFDALGLRFRETRLQADPECRVCAPGRAFPGYQDLEALCARQ